MTSQVNSLPDLDNMYNEVHYNEGNRSFDKFYHNICTKCNLQFDCLENARLHSEKIHPDIIFIPQTICIIGRKLSK